MNPLFLAPTTLPDVPPLAYLEAAASAGYDGVGLRLNASPHLPFHPVGDAAARNKMKRRLADTGMTVLDILSFYLAPQTDFEGFEPALALGAELGARYALVLGDDPDWPRLRDSFGRFCARAAAHGLNAAIECAVLRPLATLDQALRLIAETRCRNAVLCVDPLNLVRAGSTPEDLRRVDRALLPYAQISDGVLGPGEPDLAAARRNGVNQRRKPGEGVLPLHAILDALPPGLALSVELPPPSATFSAAEWARIAREATQCFLEDYHRARSHTGGNA